MQQFVLRLPVWANCLIYRIYLIGGREHMQKCRPLLGPRFVFDLPLGSGFSKKHANLLFNPSGGIPTWPTSDGFPIPKCGHGLVSKP